MAAGVTRSVGDVVVCHGPIEPTFCRYLRPWTYGVVVSADGLTDDGDTLFTVKRIPDPRRRLWCLTPTEKGAK